MKVEQVLCGGGVEGLVNREFHHSWLIFHVSDVIVKPVQISHLKYPAPLRRRELHLQSQTSDYIYIKLKQLNDHLLSLYL